METQPSPIRRQKRKQVAKACQSCRVHRIKCDRNLPCMNCKTRGTECSNCNVTLPGLGVASEEVSLLRQRVRDLERELQQERMKTTSNYSSPKNLNHPEGSPISQRLPSVVSNGDGQNLRVQHWEGVQLRPPRCSQATFFGPSSLYFYINRFSACLASSLRQNDHMISMHLHSVESGKLLEDLSVTSEKQNVHSTPALSALSPDHSGDSGPNLTATQEEYFLNHFWQSYHTSLFAILDEAKFKKHHQSLWMTSSKERKPSALVDIVLAMCMQYAVSTLPYDSQREVLVESNNNDATIAGRWYYRRCKTLMTYELESPTISTLQCQLLCAIYLCGGSFHNMVDTSSALAVRTAHTLGLHLDPPISFSPSEREERRRLWWAAYVLDTKISMKLGRPFLINTSFTMPRLPSDTFEVAMLSGSTFASLGRSSTWLSFNLQNTKLYAVVRTGFSAFYEKDVGSRNGQAVSQSPQDMEILAEALNPHITQLDDWVRNVPDELKTRRRDGGQPFSTDSSALEIERFAPLWLQRQRLLLELTYHHLCVDLYRPFISLVPLPIAGLLSEQVAMRCASHGIAFTTIAQEALSSTSILAGWHEVFQWQFGVTMTLAGFLYTYPQSYLIPDVRSAINLAISVLDIFGNSLPIAISAAKIVRDLMPKLDFLARQSHTIDTQSHHTSKELLPIPGTEVLNEQSSAVDNTWLANQTNFDVEYNNFDMTDSTLFDMAMGVEFWGDLNDLWPNADAMGVAFQ